MDPTQARQRLEAERDRLQSLRNSEEAVMTEQLESSDNELSTYDQHPGDMASDTFEREKEGAIVEHLDAALTDIERAMERLKAGSYGLCEVDGEPIPDERLEALPAARYCVRHQTEADRLARADGTRPGGPPTQETRAESPRTS